MNRFFDKLGPFTPHVLSLLRIMSGLLVVQFGTAKILKFPVVPMFANVPFLSLYWFAGMLELVLGALLVIGLLSRPVAFILAGEMAFAYFLGHAGKGFYPILNGGTLAA